MSNNIFLSHFASFPATTNAINSYSIVECEIHVYFFDAQEMAHPPMVNTQPDVDLLSLVLVIQLAFEYPSSTAENFE